MRKICCFIRIREEMLRHLMSSTEDGRQIPIERQSNDNSIALIRITCFNPLRIYYIHYILSFSI